MIFTVTFMYLCVVESLFVYIYTVMKDMEIVEITVEEADGAKNSSWKKWKKKEKEEKM